MQIQALGHVGLKVRDLHLSVPFYTQVLALKEVARFQNRMVFFSISGNHHDLALLETRPGASAAPYDSPGLAHIALKVGDNLDALRAAKIWLKTQGVPLIGSADHRVSQSLYIADPDGNQIELFVDADPQIWPDDPTAVGTTLPLIL